MVKRIDLTTTQHKEPFANPAPLGLLGLAIGCAALVPIAFGYGLTPAGFKTAAVLALLFGAGGQFLAGFMEMRNGNGFGGVIFTVFSFLWVFNAIELWAAASGFLMDHSIKIAMEVAVLIILIPLTFGFGYFSKLMFWFLVDIDVLFVCKILAAITKSTAFALPIAVLTLMLGIIAIWIALATIINPLVGKQVFRVAGPLFFAPKKRFDFSRRPIIFEVLYKHWKEHAFIELDYEQLVKLVDETDNNGTEQGKILPEIYYLWEFGYVAITQGNDTIRSCRLTAAGLDLYEQLVLGKYQI
jgi:hypothetical protein